MKTPNQILSEAFSEDFIQKMRNRVIVSGLKYPSLKETKPDTRYPRDELKNAKYRISKYEKTGNLEYLIDAANFLMFEFMEMKGEFIPVDNDPTDRIV